MRRRLRVWRSIILSLLKPRFSDIYRKEGRGCRSCISLFIVDFRSVRLDDSVKLHSLSWISIASIVADQSVIL